MRATVALACLLPPVAVWAQFGADEVRSASTPLQIIQTEPARFPEELRLRGVTEGQARVLVLVEADGRLLDAMLTAYTHARFAKEAIEVIHKWQFVPARRRGQPVSVRTEMHFTFKISGQVITVHGPDSFEKSTRPATGAPLLNLISQPEQLDDGLRPDRDVTPEWPVGASARRREARVTLDFYVDAYGRPRFISVVHSDGEEFSRAALLALAHSTYVAPLRGGEPAIVHATREYVFRRPER